MGSWTAVPLTDVPSTGVPLTDGSQQAQLYHYTLYSVMDGWLPWS